MKLKNWLVEKLNPSQRWIAQQEHSSQSREPEVHYSHYYQSLEIVNRAVNMVIDDASEVNYTIGDSISGFGSRKNIKKQQLLKLLNVQPNPFQDINSFRRDLLMDFILDGNIFIYFDGAHLYQLPANKVNIYSDTETYIEKYVFNGTDEYKPEEIIHIKDNSSTSLFRGASRLRPALRTMRLMASMRDFQDSFFKNGAVPGLVISSPDILNDRIKARMKEDWQASYNPTSGGRRPLILDGGLKVEPLTNITFKDLDFSAAIDTNKKTILEALGVPPILIDSGNNANLRPNHRLYYLETIIPIVKKISSALQCFFAFQIKEDVVGIPALQPELRDEAAYYSTLVNGGILTANEGRAGIGKEPIEGHDDLRIPQNIAGSAADPSQGGKPKDTTNGN